MHLPKPPPRKKAAPSKARPPKRKPAKAKTKRPLKSKPRSKSKPAKPPRVVETPKLEPTKTPERTPEQPKRPKRAGPKGPIDRKTAFLAAFVVTASVSAAAEAAEIDRGQHYEWLRSDPDYALRYAEARLQAGDQLEGSASQRAMVGVFEPNVFQGRFIYPQEEYVVKAEVRDARGRVIEEEERATRDVPGAQPFGMWKRSEMLHALLLRGFLPERYRQAGQFEVTGPGGGAIAVTDERLARLTDDELATLKHLHARITEANASDNAAADDRARVTDARGDSRGRKSPGA